MRKKTKFLIGTSGWNYASWQGLFYPLKLAKKYWFDYYAQFFSVVEVNATFYQLFPKSVFKHWREQAKNHFQYIVKVNRYITHIKYLKNSRNAIAKFQRRTKYLKPKLGLTLLQLPKRMPYDLKRLETALRQFDDPKKVVVEFRDKKWYTQEVIDHLTKVGAIFCLVDSPDIHLEPILTSKIAYIRMHGHTRWYNYFYSISELEDLATLAKKLSKKGAIKVYILFNNDYFSYAIQNAKTLQTLLS